MIWTHGDLRLTKDPVPDGRGLHPLILLSALGFVAQVVCTSM
jgi:hypothetical protein